MNTYKRFAVLLTLMLVASQALSQPRTFQLRAVNASNNVRDLLFGLHPDATYCADSALGELQLPPFPPSGQYEVRFVDPRGFHPDCMDQGMYVDLRPTVSSTQVDTYMVRLQPGDNGSPIQLSWPLLNAHYAAARLQDPIDGSLVNVNMRSQTLYYWDHPLNTFYIITSAPITASAPTITLTEATNITQQSVILRTVVNPNWATTTVGFRWGTDTLYGNTAAAAVLEGDEPVMVELQLFGLPPQTTYYYLPWASNVVGSALGQDRSFTTIAHGVIGWTLITIEAEQTAAVLWAGLHPAATRCVDPFLGEAYLPPVPPPGVLDARFIDAHIAPGPCFDQGISADFRPHVGPQQVDTFQIRVQPGTAGYPLTLTWPDMTNFLLHPLRLCDTTGGLHLNVDMKTTNTVQVTSSLLSSLYIIAGTRYPGSSLPDVFTVPADFITNTTAQLRGSVVPNGAPTIAWFEWGRTDSYGNSTSQLQLGSGSTVVAVAQTITGLLPGTEYHFRVVAQNANGARAGSDRIFVTTGTVDVEPDHPVPTSTKLLQNYPNPFNPSTTISFTLQTSGVTSLKVYDVLGREVATLVHEVKEPGEHEAAFNAEGLPSGVYVYRLQTGQYTSSRKMIILK